MEDYYPYFEWLYDDWYEDYSNLQKVYTTQIHPGWSGLAARLREVQRIIPDDFDDVEIMTPHNIGSHFNSDHEYEGERTNARNRHLNTKESDLSRITDLRVFGIPLHPPSFPWPLFAPSIGASTLWSGDR